MREEIKGQKQIRKMHPIQITETIEVVSQSPPNLLTPQGKDEEHASHMGKGKNQKQVSSETESYTAPKWKRLERKQNHKDQEVLHCTSLKRSGLETEGEGKYYKWRQVYHDDQEKFYELAEAAFQPGQEQ